jgi:hypothetical protein
LENGQTKFAKKIFKTLQDWREVSAVHWGDFVLHYRGRASLKVSNGLPGQVLVQVCEPARQQKIHVHTTNCAATVKGIRTFAEKMSIAVLVQ